MINKRGFSIEDLGVKDLWIGEEHKMKTLIEKVLSPDRNLDKGCRTSMIIGSRVPTKEIILH